jgi:hypothetical protein
MPQENVDMAKKFIADYNRRDFDAAVESFDSVATFRDGRMVRLEYFGSWAEALEAAGLRE